MIVLEVLRTGVAKDIVAIKREGKCFCSTYIKALDRKTRVKLKAVLQLMAKNGVIGNTEKFRYLRDGIFEFKAGTARVFCFFHQNMVVCTHGQNKPKPRQLKAAIDRAKNLRNQFMEEGR